MFDMICSMVVYLGVNAIDLCLSNCTWIEQYSEDLYPLDAGIDSGKTYTVRLRMTHWIHAYAT
jgi:hypothetical protein